MQENELKDLIRNKSLKELEEWCWKIYKKSQDQADEIERLKKQKASDTIKKTNAELRKENKNLKARLNKILNAANLQVIEAVEAEN